MAGMSSGGLRHICLGSTRNSQPFSVCSDIRIGNFLGPFLLVDVVLVECHTQQNNAMDDTLGIGGAAPAWAASVSHSLSLPGALYSLTSAPGA